MFNWLLVAYWHNLREKRAGIKDFKKYKPMYGQKMIIFCFGPYVSSAIEMYIVDNNGFQNLHSFESIPIIVKNENDFTFNRYKNKVKHMMSKIKALKLEINGVFYYGHASSITIGAWYSTKIFLTVADFTTLILIPLQPIIIAWDACYMGLMSPVYEMCRVKSLKYVVASPISHPSTSILEMKSFKDVGNPNIQLEKTLYNITCEFQAMPKPSYRCLIVLELKKFQPLVKKLGVLLHPSKIDKYFDFVDKNQIDPDDNTTFDLYRSCIDHVLKKQIKNVHLHTCNIDACKTTKGISIDLYVPHKYRYAFKQMQWYKKLKNVLRDDENYGWKEEKRSIPYVF